MSNVPFVIEAENVNEAFFMGLRRILEVGKKVQTRNGPALVHPGTLITHYRSPNQRMLFVPQREANPFFHILESIWMLSGSQDVEFPAYYVPSMKNFSDNGRTLNGAYGYRWRNSFGIDQLDAIVDTLKTDPESRRVVLQMWDTNLDLVKVGLGSKDVACNLLVKYYIRDHKLHASVCCRSNDMVLGGYGANAVHFSFLQEYLCDRLRDNGLAVTLGTYDQVGMDSHIYTELYPDKMWARVQAAIEFNKDTVETNLACIGAYSRKGYNGFQLMTISPVRFEATLDGGIIGNELVRSDIERTCAAEFDRECKVCVTFRNGARSFGIRSPYLKYIVLPLMEAYEFYKKDNLEGALKVIDVMRTDLRSLFPSCSETARLDVEVACTEWLERRVIARSKKGTV